MGKVKWPVDKAPVFSISVPEKAVVLIGGSELGVPCCTANVPADIVSATFRVVVADAEVAMGLTDSPKSRIRPSRHPAATPTTDRMELETVLRRTFSIRRFAYNCTWSPLVGCRGNMLVNGVLPREALQTKR